MQKTGKMQTDNCLQLPKYAIIVAGGKGLRMGGEIPKQFRPISGHPVLMHTLEAFYRYDPEIRIILVLPEEHQNYWNDLCLQYQFTLKHRVVTGGRATVRRIRRKPRGESRCGDFRRRGIPASFPSAAPPATGNGRAVCSSWPVPCRCRRPSARPAGRRRRRGRRSSSSAPPPSSALHQNVE